MGEMAIPQCPFLASLRCVLELPITGTYQTKQTNKKKSSTGLADFVQTMKLHLKKMLSNKPSNWGGYMKSECVKIAAL